MWLVRLVVLALATITVPATARSDPALATTPAETSGHTLVWPPAGSHESTVPVRAFTAEDFAGHVIGEAKGRKPQAAGARVSGQVLSRKVVPAAFLARPANGLVQIGVTV